MLGQGSPSAFDPGAAFEIRRVGDNGLAFSGVPASFSGGATHASSGDRGWWADFSGLGTPGDYYLQLPGGSSPGAVSHPFRIGDDVYNAALAASSKSFYYQRCGTAITAGHGGAWTHAACHVGTQGAALLYNGGAVGGTARDITGGWHDAGDYRKYVSFAAMPLWDLLTSYEWNPCAYGDASNIPESGNGVPDVLDEVKWELDWLLRMQIASGPNAGALYSGAFVAGGSGGTGDPSTEATTYYYANYSSAATGVGAFAFAQGARILGAFPAYAGYAATLQTAAEAAWAWLQANPANLTYNHSGFSNADANRDANGDAQLRLLAAVQLWRLTGLAAYKSYFDAHYIDDFGECGHHPLNNTNYGYRNVFDGSCNGLAQRAYVDYCLGPSPTAAIVTQIRTAAAGGANNAHNGEAGDLYRAFMWDGHYSWGSNQVKAAWAQMLLWAVKIGANPAMSAAWADSASEYVHWYFGRNPLGWSYTTQSQLVGAEQSITRIYHGWFHEGTAYESNPAPGILAGGPNQYYAADVASAGGTAVYPPAGEPVQKSYRDWNKVWPDASWTVTENGIYYQARYQFLLAAHASCAGPQPSPTPSPTSTSYAGTPTFTRTPSPSPTATATLTPVCQTLLNGAETLLENGTWSGSLALRSIVPAGSAPPGAVTQGGSALLANITSTAAWNDGFANLSSALPADWSPYAELRMDVHVAASLVAGATYSELLLRADCASCGAGLWYQPISADTPTLSAGAQTVAWALDFSQGTLPPGAAVSRLSLVYNNNASAPTGSIYIDNVRLLGACTAPSATPSPTPTPTPTRSGTGSPTLSATATASPSPSATLTRTEPGTATPSGTPSATPSPTSSASPSATASPSFSASPTESPYAGSPTDTPSPSPSPSETATLSASPSPSPSPSETATPSASPSFSPSPPETATPSASPSFSPSPSETAMPSASPSPSASPVASATSTATATPSPTVSSSASATLTATPSASAPASPSPTWTLTALASSTATPAAPSPSASASPSPTTSTPTPLPDAGTLLIEAAVAWPQPNARALRVRLSGAAESVRMRVYTPAWVLVFEIQGGAAPAGWSELSLQASPWPTLPSGLYYADVQALRGAVRSPRRSLRLVLLR